MPNPHAQLIVDLASANRCVEIWYRKGATSEPIHPRTIEPYTWVEGKQDLMIRAYQVEPEPGWRFFMVHKIEAARDAGSAFKPRRAVHLPTGIISESYIPTPNWTEGRRLYRDLVGDAMADGKLDAAERAEIARVHRAYELTAADTRYVHASIYHRCLGAIIDDGWITDDEQDQIRYLHRVMTALGWAVGD